MKPLIFVCIVLKVLLNYCFAQQYVDVQIKYAPKLALSPGPNLVLLINQFDCTKTTLKDQKAIDVIKAGIYTSIKYAGEQLKQLPEVKVINLVDSAQLTLNTDSINLLALKYHASYVLMLKGFKADFAVTYDTNMLINYNMLVKVNFVLFESNGIYFKKLNGETEDPLPMASLLASLHVYPAIKKNKKIIIISARHAVLDALQDYLPNNISRPLYTDKIFAPANIQMTTGNFKAGCTLLTPFLQDSDALTVYKAAYNLAVAYEGDGDIEKAIDMAKLSLAKVYNPFAANLLEDLQKE
jgi:hypothetical protein